MRHAVIGLAALIGLSASAAIADRRPTPEERAAIEAKLTAEGYTKWESIELEDDGSAWEVDDAVGADGREYDLELQPGSLEILRRDPDDGGSLRTDGSTGVAVHAVFIV